MFHSWPLTGRGGRKPHSLTVRGEEGDSMKGQGKETTFLDSAREGVGGGGGRGRQHVPQLAPDRAGEKELMS